jgi:hypothetical protein
MALALSGALAGLAALVLRAASNKDAIASSKIPLPPEVPAKCVAVGVQPWPSLVLTLTGRSLLPRDAWFIRKCREMVKTNIAPIHSGLLVCAVISFVDVNGRRKFTVGQNGEPCVIAGALCAERGALMK